MAQTRARTGRRRNPAASTEWALGVGAVVSMSTRRLGNVMHWSASVYQACIGLQMSDSEIETETAVANTATNR